MLFWPLPLMALAADVGITDLAALAGVHQSRLPASTLLLGMWMSGVVAAAGAMEIAASRQRTADWRGLVAPAVLVASGMTAIARALAGTMGGQQMMFDQPPAGAMRMSDGMGWTFTTGAN